MKILKEDNDNKYAKAIHEVEKFMDEKEVRLEIYSGDTIFVYIKDRCFRMKSPNFPRLVEEDHLEVYGEWS